MTEQPLTRRRMLTLAGSTVAISVAGCSNPLSDDGEDADGMHDDESHTGGNGRRDGGMHDDERRGTDGRNHDGRRDSPRDGSEAHDNHDVNHSIGHPEATIEVSMVSDSSGHHFVPHIVHIEPGGTVTWVLERGVHDTVAYHPGNAALLPSASEQRIPDNVSPWASNVYETRGETFQLGFEQEGVYDYVCTVRGHDSSEDGRHGGHNHRGSHESTGMVGRVIVGSPELDPDVQPALKSPPNKLPDAARHELTEFNERTRAALSSPDEP